MMPLGCSSREEKDIFPARLYIFKAVTFNNYCAHFVE